MITISVVLAPIAAIGTWAHGQLADTDRFVQTFAPLAQEPEVQALIASQVTDAIEASVDIGGLVNDLVQGVDGLDLPPRAKTAIGLPAAPGGRRGRSPPRRLVEVVAIAERPIAARLRRFVEPAAAARVFRPEPVKIHR